MAHGEKNLASFQNCGIEMQVEVRAVSDVITFLLEPIGHREFPEQISTRAAGLRCVDALAVLGVRAVETHAHIRPGVPDLRTTVVVQRIPSGPFVVRLPGQIARLAQDIRRAAVLYHEHDVTLSAEWFIPSELAQIHAAGPVFRNAERRGLLPFAFADALDCHHRYFARLRLEWPQPGYVPRTGARVMTQPVNVQ